MVGIIAAGFFTKMVTSGMGQHISCLPPQSVISMLEFGAISEAINVIGIGVVKISVCLTLLRVVERGRRRISRFLWFLLVFIGVTHLALAMLFFLHCRPLAALWIPQVHGSCLSTHTTVLAGYIGFAIDVVTDLICAGIPVLVIHRLQRNNQTKVALCILMGLGVFTAVCAVIKAITLKGVFANDYTWGFTKPATWAALEQFIGIIIPSVPALRPLFGGLLEYSYNWSHMLLNTRKYLSWGSKHRASGPHESSRRQGEIHISEQITPKSQHIRSECPLRLKIMGGKVDILQIQINRQRWMKRVRRRVLGILKKLVRGARSTFCLHGHFLISQIGNQLCSPSTFSSCKSKAINEL